MYKGYTIPNNTLLSACPDSLHRDLTLYDNPEAFLPERYLGDDVDAFVSARQNDYRKRDHINYGFGRRMCPGMSLLYPPCSPCTV